MKIDITTPTLTDIDILHRWGEENWQLWGDEKNKWFSKKSLRRWFLDPEDDILLVAKKDNQLIGMCITGVMRDWAVCWGLFVEKEFRGHGLGQLFLKETEKRLKKISVESLILLVDDKNIRAKKFYEREGFYTGFRLYLMTKNFK